MVENNHEITNNELARIIAEGFHGVDERFDSTEKRFDGVDSRLNGIDARLDNIEKILLGEHTKRIEKLEEQVKELRDLLAMK